MPAVELHHQSPKTRLLKYEVIFGQVLSSATGAGIWPVVCLDEFEQLTKNPQEFSDVLYNSWRSLISASRIAFVTASQTSLDRLSRGGKLTSPFFNVFMLVPLGEFTPEEARVLVDRGRTCDRPFSDKECQGILKLAGRHPCRLQVACSLLYEAKTGGQLVGLKAVRREYQRQIDYFFGPRPAWWQAALAWAWRGLRWLLLSPRYVGRLARVIGFTWDDVWNWIVGVVVLVLIFLLLLRVIAPDMFFKWLGRILGVGP